MPFISTGPLPSIGARLRASPVASALLLTAVLLGVLSLVELDKGLNLADEGFLWYGVQRTLSGEVPLRDFMAYDPARYYVIAGFMALSGSTGVEVQRVALAVIQFLGIAVLLAALTRDARLRSVGLLLATALAVSWWCVPTYKVPDTVCSMVVVASLSFALESVTVRRFYWCGVVVGFLAVWGRNHALYGVFGFGLAFLFLAAQRGQISFLVKPVLAWGAGIAVGFLPVVAMLVAVPEFAQWYWYSIRFLFEIKATNLELPVPWPWRADFAHAALPRALWQALVGVYFVGLIAFGVLAPAYAFMRRGGGVSPMFLASAFLALPYAHYAFSRADTAHLALGIMPLLIGSLVVLGHLHTPVLRWAGIAALVATAGAITYDQHPVFTCRIAKCAKVNVGGEMLRVPLSTKQDIGLLERMVASYAPGGRDYLVTPFYPGMAAVHRRRSPMWETYALFPRGEAFERAEIERIKAAKPGFVMVIDVALDGRQELKFQSTHPLIYSYITATFDPVANVPPPFLVYRERGGG